MFKNIPAKFIRSSNNIDYHFIPSIYFNVQDIEPCRVELYCSLKTRNCYSTKTLVTDDRRGQHMSRDAVLETLLGQLSVLIQCRSITSAKLSPDDNIFKIISVNEFETLINTSSIDFKIILLQPIKEITSLTEQLSILTHYHNHPLEEGLTGFRRTYEKFKSPYIWPGMFKYISDLIKNYNSCKINKSKPATKEPMQITP